MQFYKINKNNGIEDSIVLYIASQQRRQQPVDRERPGLGVSLGGQTQHSAKGEPFLILLSRCRPVGPTVRIVSDLELPRSKERTLCPQSCSSEQGLAGSATGMGEARLMTCSQWVVAPHRVEDDERSRKHGGFQMKLFFIWHPFLEKQIYILKKCKH